MGEPAGVGGELSLKAWAGRDAGTPVFFVLDNPARLTALARTLGLPVAVREILHPAEAAGAFATALPVMPLAVGEVTPGTPDPGNAPAVIGAIERAVSLALSGRVAGIVTNPIQKAPLAAAGFQHTGHTDFLGHLAGCETDPVMMLVARGLRVVPVTVHVALGNVFELLSPDLIVRTARQTAEGLTRYFGISTPRLAVAGLNPHAGEDGMFGDEEMSVIRPAVDALRQQGLQVTGPLPADSMFHEEARAGYDAALCMYHDQALIPLKTLDFHGGVNVTLGLPFVRTSPDHGTALDIAGTGAANPASFAAALHLAADMARHGQAALSGT